MILLIDNYDSFSYNLYQLIGRVETDIRVYRNDKIKIKDILEMNPELIVLSPGPGKPEDAGICPQVVKELAGKIPIFGVCLGHQVICQAFGATVTYASRMMHGKTSQLELLEHGQSEQESQDSNHYIGTLFQGVAEPVIVARYHSLSAEKSTIPEELVITAVAEDDGEVMAVEHREYPVYGVQFHPESVLTPQGLQMIQNMMGK